MKWITRSNVKVDRVACPWLILRFIDPDAKFIFVKEDELLESARRESAIPFDANRFTEVKLNHRGDHCTFETIVEEFKLTEPALTRLGFIIRAADIKGQEHVAPEGRGLRAVAEGFARLGISDEERLVCQFPIYDALLAYVKGIGASETGSGRRKAESGRRKGRNSLPPSEPRA
ncbi:MAG TPA: chromate resistance protein ChrB domain-containing protein [Acidobacteriota bacterium]|jgi:hypothetical protein